MPAFPTCCSATKRRSSSLDPALASSAIRSGTVSREWSASPTGLPGMTLRRTYVRTISATAASTGTRGKSRSSQGSLPVPGSRLGRALRVPPCLRPGRAYPQSAAVGGRRKRTPSQASALQAPETGSGTARTGQGLWLPSALSQSSEGVALMMTGSFPFHSSHVFGFVTSSHITCATFAMLVLSGAKRLLTRPSCSV